MRWPRSAKQDGVLPVDTTGELVEQILRRSCAHLSAHGLGADVEARLLAVVPMLRPWLLPGCDAKGADCGNPPGWFVPDPADYSASVHIFRRR